MSRCCRQGIVLGVGAVLIAGAVWFAGNYFRWWVPDVDVVEPETKFGEPRPATMDEALALVHEAQARAASIKDYQCIYIRDEFLKGEWQKNQVLLKVRHEPFSVYMEWQAPKERVGRKVAYPADGDPTKMLVKDQTVTFGFTVRRNIKDSVDKGESKRTIADAGLKKMIERFVHRWQEEKNKGLTKVTIQEVEVRVPLHGREIVRPCCCVTTLHEPKDREHFTFYRTLLYFDKETGLPIRLQGFDWPASASDTEGRLLEDYVYVDIKPNLGLTDKDFKW